MTFVNWKGFGRKVKHNSGPIPELTFEIRVDATTRIKHEMKCCGQDSNLALFTQPVNFTAETSMLHFTVVKVYNMRKKLFTQGMEMCLCSDSTPSCDISLVTGLKYKAIYKFA